MKWVPRLMVLEALVNLVTGFVYIFNPMLLLGFLRHPDHHSFNAAEMQVWGFFGAVIVTQAVVLLGAAYARGPAAVPMRRNAYLTLLVGEVVLVPMVWLFIHRFGTWNLSAIGFLGSLIVFGVGRVWVLYFASPRLLTDEDKEMHLSF